MTCKHCGYILDGAHTAGACAGCPLAGRCRTRCPRCGAASGAAAVFFGRLRRRLGRRWHGPCRANRGPVSPLSEGRAGEAAEVVRLAARNGDELRRLTAFGILPGVRLALIQRYPAFVLQLGRSQVALDRENATSIHVRWLTSEPPLA